MELDNVFLERDIISYILENPSHTEDIAKVLTPHVFTDSTLQLSYIACIELYEFKGVFGRSDLFRALKSKGVDKEANQILTIATDGIIDIQATMDRVNELYHRRKLLDASHKVIELLSSGQNSEGIYYTLEELITKNNEENFFNTEVVDSSKVFDNVIQDYEEFVGKEKISGVTTGSRTLDYATGGWKEGLIVIGARPSMGKTIVGLDLAKQSAKSGMPTLYISLEMNSKDLFQRLISSEVPEFSYTDLMNYRMTREDIDRIKESTAKGLKELPLYIYDSDNRDVNYLVNLITTQTRRNKIKMVVIDYLQLMKDSLIKDQSDFAQVSSISNKVQKLTRKLGLPIVALSQLSRNVESRGDKRPMLADIRSSGNIEQDASIVIGLHRPSYYQDDIDYEQMSDEEKHLLEFVVLKNRNGQTGITKRYVDVKTNRISDVYDLYDFDRLPRIDYKDSKINEIPNGFDSETYEEF